MGLIMRKHIKRQLAFITTWAMLGGFLASSPGAGASGRSDEAVVSAPVGTIEGVQKDDVLVFKGIPYAAAPIGEKRWQPPVPFPDWEGLRKAKKFGPACIQPKSRPGSIYAEDYAAMSENCLSLNVWTKQGAKNAPVLVWIHGGSLMTGAGSTQIYDGARMAGKGLVVVTINYRLGILGYFAHPELSAESNLGISGNYGLQDQIEALRWVKRNIAAFGGDPDNVTIAGESAGALSVMYLMASPPAHGLFGKAIVQSAYMISTPSLKEERFGHPALEAIGQSVQEKLGAANIAEMRAIGPHDLTARAPQTGFAPFGVVDGHFLPRQIAETFDRGEQAQVPVLAGFNEGEIRSLRFLLPPKPSDASDYEERIRSGYGELADLYLTLYPSDNMEESMLAATRDAMYGWTAERLVFRQSGLGLPSYLYMFDHGYPAADENGLHAFHAAEIPYVFGTLKNTSAQWPKIPRTARERELSDNIMNYWVSFARNGTPVAADAPSWPAYSEGKSAMVFANKPKAIAGLSGQRYALHEEVVCRRMATGDMQWNWNVGIISPPLPSVSKDCR